MDLGDDARDPESAAPAIETEPVPVESADGDRVADTTVPDAGAPASDEAEPVFAGAADVTQPISVVRTAEPLAYGVEQVGAGNPGTPRVRDTGLTDTGDHDVVRGEQPAEEAMNGTGPRPYAPPAGGAGRAVDSDGRRRLVVGAAAVGGAVALGGVILAVPWLHSSDTSRSAPAVAGFATPNEVPRTSASEAPAPTSRPPTSTPASPSPSTARAPIDTRPAQVPAVQYTAPPPPPTQSYVSPGQPRRAVPRLPAIPRRRTIPNPIPGLPPIVIP